MPARSTAAELYRRAVEEGNAGRHASARRHLQAALARHPDADTAALAVGTLAYLDSETGSPDIAIAAIEHALAGEGLRDETRAVLTSQRGLLELRRGRADAAIADLTSAIERLDAVPLSLGRAHLNRGLVRLDRSDVVGAEADFAAAADAFARAGEPVEQAKARSNAGYAAMLRGDLAVAIRTMGEAAEVLGALSPVMRAVCDGDRAEALLAAGMTTDASRLLADAARVYGARRLRQTQAEAEVLLARALLAEDPAAAADAAARAARRFRARGNDAWATRADALIATGRLRSRAATPADVQFARSTATALDALHRTDDAALLRLELVEVALAAGRTVEAVATRATVHADASDSLTLQVRADEADAELARARRDRPAVLEAAAHGVATLTTWQASLGSLELHSGAGVHGRRLAVLGVGAAVEGGDPQQVLDWSERVRTLSGSFPPLRPPADPRVAEVLTELRELQRADPTAAGRRRAEALRDEVRRAHWADAGAASRTDALVALDELRAALRADGAVFVAHLWTGDGFAALVVSPDGHGRIVELGGAARVEVLLAGLLADLDIAASALPPGLRVTVDAALAARLAELDALLVAPLGAELAEAERVVLTPAGALASIPWTMLPGLETRPLAVAESARSWLDARGARAIRSAGFAAGPGVARAAEELAASAEAWPDGVVELLGQAGAAAVTATAERVDLLHIAAHGRHAAEHPLFSGFELADGPWFGYDIDQLARVPDVVVMSACELGRSTHRWGLEALGMARAWLHAGARTVLASPAAMSDGQARELLPAVHRALADGLGASDALAQARRSTGISTPLLVRGAGW